MHKTPSHTAILLFALNPSEEVRRKKIRKGRKLFSALTRDTLAQLEATGLPYFHFDGAQQEGLTFGERFSNALEHLFEQGYDNIIALGNDCPQLRTHHISFASKLLLSGENVVAPSLDGGFNLLGIRQKDFNKVAFEKLPWQTSALFRSTMDYFKSSGATPKLLASFSDIDSRFDMASLFWSGTEIDPKLQLLLSLCLEFETTVVPEVATPYSYRDSFSLPPNRGSPLLLL